MDFETGGRKFQDPFLRENRYPPLTRASPGYNDYAVPILCSGCYLSIEGMNMRLVDWVKYTLSSMVPGSRYDALIATFMNSNNLKIHCNLSYNNFELINTHHLIKGKRYYIFWHFENSEILEEFT